MYGTEVEDTEYLALVRGDVATAAAEGKTALVRVQAMCPIGDSLRTRPDLQLALEAIDRSGNGVFLYVLNKARMNLERAFDRQVLARPSLADGTPAAGSAQTEALRDFGLGAQVLADLGCKKIRLLSNTDRKIVGIEGFGIEVVERVGFEESAGSGDPRRVLKLTGGKRGPQGEGV
jgi:3,4-dihydroxy 2-butanone 4-phosphate synthase/GTP cyclohydrolase II